MLNFPDAPVAGQAFPPFIFDGVKWDRIAGAPPSSAVPAMNGPGTPGVASEYTRGDHVHPIDSSRAPTVSPSFSGGVTADAITVASEAHVTGSIRAEGGRIVPQMGGGIYSQPSVCVHSIGSTGGRGVAKGYFLDSGNYLAFGSMDGAGNPISNDARFDNAGHIWLNGTAVLGRDPTSPMEAASKQYVDGRAAGAGGAYLPLAGGSMSGLLYPNLSPGSLTQGGGGGSLEIQSGGGHDACLTFHRPGAFACNFGLGSDHNFWYGGWSFGGGVAYRFWTTRDFGGFPISNERMVHAGDANYPPSQALYEPWGGSIVTGMSGHQPSGAWYKRHRYWQVLTTGWWTVGYA